MITDFHLRMPGASNPEAIKVQDLLQSAKARGAQGAVLTSVAPFMDTQGIRAAAAAEGIKVFLAREIATTRGYLLVMLPGHEAETGDAWLPPGAAGGHPGTADVVEAVNQKGGVVIALHPYDRQLLPVMGDQIFGIRNLHAVEAANARVPAEKNELACEAADNLRLPTVGGSGLDTDENKGFGNCLTLIVGEPETEDDLIALVREGEVFALEITNLPKPRANGGGFRGGGRDRDRDRGGRGERGERGFGRDRGGPRGGRPPRRRDTGAA